MVEEVLENLVYKENGNYVDCTFGAGGHSKKILDKLCRGYLQITETSKGIFDLKVI